VVASRHTLQLAVGQWLQRTQTCQRSVGSSKKHVDNGKQNVATRLLRFVQAENHTEKCSLHIQLRRPSTRLSSSTALLSKLQPRRGAAHVVNTPPSNTTSMPLLHRHRPPTANNMMLSSILHRATRLVQLLWLLCSRVSLRVILSLDRSMGRNTNSPVLIKDPLESQV